MQYENPKIPEGINVSTEHPLKEFSLLVLGLSLVFVIALTIALFAADYLVKYIPYSWEQRFASYIETSFPQNIESNTIEAENISAEEIAQLQASKTQVENYLQQLVAEISELQQIPEDEPVTLHYIDSDVVNAFATLGNHVFVFTGLLEKLPNENALFMVLSHEVAHLKHKDPIRALGRGITLSFLLSVIGGVTDGNAIGQHFGQAGLLTALSFNRDQERAADLTGLETLTDYYGHSKGATEFFEFILAELNAGSSYEIFNSHPLTEDRIQTLLANSQITNQPTKPLPEFVQAHLSQLKQIRQPKQESVE